MPPQTEIQKTTPKLGLHLVGMVMSKNVFATEKGDRHSLDIASTGLRSLVSLGVEKDVFDSHSEMGVFDGDVSFNTFKGKIYFNHVPVSA